MLAKISLGSAPAEESCAQLGTPGYEFRAHQECDAYINQLKRFVTSAGKELPPGFALRTLPCPHDFGTYFEVFAVFEDEDRESWAFTEWLMSKSPCEWDEEATLIVRPPPEGLDDAVR